MGGVEAVLRAHHARDADVGIESRFVAFWEKASPDWPRNAGMDFRRGMTVRKARRLVSEACREFEPEVSVHHTLWGQPYWGDLDPAPRRVLFLHSDVPGLAEKLASRMPGMDAVLAVSDALLDRAREAAPGWDSGRFSRIHYPVFGPAAPLQEREPVGERPIVIGYSGRLEREQKRVERFVELAARLDARRLRWRLEFLGDGKVRAALERALPDRSRVVFHGRQSGEAYWRIVDGWDAIAFTSDYEGTPIALLEAMSRGVVPLHPRIGSGGDGYAGRVDPGLVYPAGDMDALAESVAGLTGWDATRWADARSRARALMEPHAGGNYLRSFGEFVERVAAMPALERPLPRRWRFPADRLTFAQWEWIAGLRRRG